MSNASEALPAQKWPRVTVAQAHAISAMADPVLRNLKITQGYHDLKIALTRLFGAKNVTWCGYATWASKTAGKFIRGEGVPERMRDALAGVARLEASIARVNRALGGLYQDATAETSFISETLGEVSRGVTKGVAQGNLIVFQELAPLYAAWLDTFETPPVARDQEAIDAFIATRLTPGAVENGGQDLLIQAFHAYYDCMLEKDGGKKAQYMFLANALVGYHEQTRLQGPITSALRAPITDLLLAKVKRQALEKAAPRLHGLMDLIVGEALRPLAERMAASWQAIATSRLITLSLPDVALPLGEDVPRFSSERMFPAELETATLPALVDLLAKLDRTPDTVVGSAASDWCDLGDRMSFVVDFFRTRQQDASLYQPPFTDEQVAVICNGGLPRGCL
jgi:hypothetical protein